MPLRRTAVLLALAVLAPTRAPGQTGPAAASRSAVLRLEDARPTSADAWAPLVEALRSPDSVTRILASRALGRLEQPELVDALIPTAESADPALRAEAVNAIGQSVYRADAAGARRWLESRLALESDPGVRGVLFRTLGRLPLPPEGTPGATELLLIRGTGGPGGDAPEAALLGATHGLLSLYRRTAARHPPSVTALERLVELTTAPRPVAVRRRAMAAFVASGRTDSGALLDALRDADVEVRRLAVQAAGAQADLPGRERIVARALRDPAGQVRWEALRAYGRRLLARDGCEPAVLALDDPDPHVRLLATDLLGGCGSGAAGILRRTATAPFGPDDWHEPAHALVSLATVAPAAAESLLARYQGEPVWWARLYAARAARAVGAVPVLEALAWDPQANVREAALEGLRALRGHQADRFYLAALAATDYQLVLTAARALDSSPDPGPAVPALLAALQRITRERRETSRDPRAAILAALGTLGAPAQDGALRPYLTDFDPAIAAQAAELLTRWTGRPHTAAPRPLRPQPVPSWEELARLEALRPVLVMRGGGRIVLRLRPFEAPTNAARFVRLARAGWFDGLTFHRVAPNFVVQGGSPGANEYVGDGPYTRDELGLASHVRGTVGLSTRGRDTGDGQIFINLVDNLRLDHDYTIFAEVVEGMDVVDGLLEGAVIERVEIGGEGR
jgi:cyclophilin family peptidyl-prolyl cis-trans isomerase/HEAT repeat protein